MRRTASQPVTFGEVTFHPAEVRLRQSLVARMRLVYRMLTLFVTPADERPLSDFALTRTW